MNKILKQILILKKAGRTREADNWINHSKIPQQSRIVLLNCINEFNAARRFEIGSKLPPPLERRITKHDVRMSMKGWGYHGRFCRRIAAIVFGEKFVQEIVANNSKKYRETLDNF